MNVLRLMNKEPSRCWETSTRRTGATVPAFRSYEAAAIDLNNEGLSLIERRCYQEALETFRNALDVCHKSRTAAEVEHILYRAYLQLSSVTDDDSEELWHGASASKIYPDKEVNLVILDQFGNNTSISQGLGMGNKNKIFPIQPTMRLWDAIPVDRFKAETHDSAYYSFIYYRSVLHSQEEVVISKRSLLESIILFNVGQVHCLIARHVSGLPTKAVDEHLSKAYQYFCKCYEKACIRTKDASSFAPNTVWTTKFPMMTRNITYPEYQEIKETSRSDDCAKARQQAQRVITLWSHRQPPRFKSNPAA